MRTLLVSAAVFLAMCLVGGAAIDSVPWGMNGSSCRVGDPAIQSNLYLITGGSVKFQSSATGLITLYCPVTGYCGPPVGRPTIGLTYTDESGTGTDANITAQLVRLAKPNGGFSTVSGVLNSDSRSATSHRISASFTHSFDCENFVYYVRVDLNRRTPASQVIFFGTDLQ